MKVPKYRRYKSIYAKVVFPGGREVHLGPYDAAESRAKYDRLVAEFLLNERKSPPPKRLATQRRVNDIAGVLSVLTVADLAVKYYEYAEGYYQKNGRPTGELCWVKYAMRLLLQVFADIPVNEFGPKQLKLARDKMIEQGLSRVTINHRVQKIVIIQTALIARFRLRCSCQIL